MRWWLKIRGGKRVAIERAALYKHKLPTPGWVVCGGPRNRRRPLRRPSRVSHQRASRYVASGRWLGPTPQTQRGNQVCWKCHSLVCTEQGTHDGSNDERKICVGSEDNEMCRGRTWDKRPTVATRLNGRWPRHKTWIVVSESVQHSVRTRVLYAGCGSELLGTRVLLRLNDGKLGLALAGFRWHLPRKLPPCHTIDGSREAEPLPRQPLTFLPPIHIGNPLCCGTTCISAMWQTNATPTIPK